jgi:hypothetical protein
MMQFTTPTGAFHITSHGNGWAYEVHCQTTGKSLWFQDDDAASIQKRSEDFTNEVLLGTYIEYLCE